jgi:FlaA1/EpsC-like NDP-sugar epimerase
VLGVYRGVWRYLDVNDLARFFRAAIGSFVFVATGIFLLFTIGDFPTSSDYSPIILLLFAVFVFLGLATTRSSFKVLDLYFGRQVQTEEESVVICGAGDLGEMALRWIIMNPQLNLKPIGFLDEDPFLRGRQIHGVEVLGGMEDIETILANREVGGVIVAENPKVREASKDMIMACKNAGCWIKYLRLEFEEID